MANAILNIQQYFQEKIAQDAKFLDEFFISLEIKFF